MQGLVHTLLSAEGESSIDFCRDLAGNDLEDLGAELHKEVIKGGVDLLVNVLAMVLAILDRLVDERSVLRLLRRGED